MITLTETKDNILKLVDWVKLSKESNKVYLVDVDITHVQNSEISHRFDKDSLLQINELVTYSIHELHSQGTMLHYKIVEKVIDERGNLVIFAKSQAYQVEEV